jgi:hypothetical protein
MRNLLVAAPCLITLTLSAAAAYAQQPQADVSVTLANITTRIEAVTPTILHVTVTPKGAPHHSSTSQPPRSEPRSPAPLPPSPSPPPA